MVLLVYAVKQRIMSISLLSKVQQNLGYPELKKIDPNTQEVSMDEKSAEHRFSQAAIPAVLISLNNYAQDDTGAEEILRGDNSTNWADKLFNENRDAVISSIESYSGEPTDDVINKINSIAAEAEKVTKENLPELATIKDLKAFLSNQKKDILLYLPAELNIGGYLHNDTLDDNTNKMEGPVSSLMHSIGSAFSNPVTEDEKKFDDN